MVVLYLPQSYGQRSVRAIITDTLHRGGEGVREIRFSASRPHMPVSRRRRTAVDRVADRLVLHAHEENLRVGIQRRKRHWCGGHRKALIGYARIRDELVELIPAVELTSHKT